MTIEGCDVLTIEDGPSVHNDSGDVARQLGLLPDNGTPAQLRLAGLSHLGTRARHAARTAEPDARPYFAAMLPLWDGGALQIAGTVSAGDEVAGFRVVELPGHAPGLIGLHRESDGCSDAVSTLDPQTGRWRGPRVPHPAFDADLAQAYASIAALADLHPSVVWAGHADPVRGDVDSQLRAAASGG